jgi:phage shock protein C
MNISDEIKRLHELHQAGALTDAEFEQAKAKLLDASRQNRLRVPATATWPANIAQRCGAPRSRTDRWLGGVCGGLARVSGVDAWIWRLVFVLFTISFGFGLVIYC